MTLKNSDFKNTTFQCYLTIEMEADAIVQDGKGDKCC